MQTTEIKTLILAGDGYALSIDPKAEELKSELLAESSKLTAVLDTASSEVAKEQVKKLARMRRLVEVSRNTVKAPVLQVGRDIDAKAKQFLADVQSEEERLKELVGDYAEKVEEARRKAIEEERKAAAERERLEREAEEARLEAERKAAEAKKAEEDALWADSEEATAKAQEAAKVAEEQNQLAETVAASIQDIVQVVGIVPAKTEGVKFAYDFEVRNIDTLYRFSPSLVKMEPKRAEILAKLKEHTGDDLPEIPGLTITRKPIVSTR